MAKLVKQISEYFDVDEKYIKIRLKKHNKFYKKVYIPKKDGSYREVYLPSIEIKAIQYFILENYLSKIEISKYAMAYKKDCSILDNANVHLKNKYFLKVDLIDFFYSLNYDVAKKTLSYYFEKEIGEDGVDEMLNFISYENHFVQGCVTSPYLSNIIFKDIDYLIADKFSKIPNFRYTRYSDDIVISSSKKIDFSVLDELKRILKEFNYNINCHKTYFTSNSNSVRITGLNIYKQSSIKVGTKYKKELKNMIYHKLKYGSDSNESCEIILGKLMFLKYIEPEYYNFLNVKYMKSNGCLLIETLKRMNKEEVKNHENTKQYSDIKIV